MDDNPRDDRSNHDHIEKACQRLCLDYSRYVDFRQYDRFVALFTEDGVLDTGFKMEGRAAIEIAMSKRPDTLRSRHVVTNHIVDVIDEENAQGITYLTLYRAITDEAKDPDFVLPFDGPAAIGHYTDKYRKTKDGWRFAPRELTFTFQNPEAFPKR